MKLLGVMRRSFCAVILTTVSACGTFDSRLAGGLVGAYPLQAVGTDLWLIAQVGQGERVLMGLLVNGRGMMVCGLLSLPIDVVLDVMLLPCDVVAWILGIRKCPDDLG